MITSGIQWNEISIILVPKLFLPGKIFQENVDISFGMKMNNME